MEELTFEQAFTQLEQAVVTLEAGDLALAEALALFERGMQLAALADRQLSAAALRVRQIIPDSASYETTPLEDWQGDSGL
jgi:exodeoxyribonuclease VII small subunit